VRAVRRALGRTRVAQPASTATPPERALRAYTGRPARPPALPAARTSLRLLARARGLAGELSGVPSGWRAARLPERDRSRGLRELRDRAAQGERAALALVAIAPHVLVVALVPAELLVGRCGCACRPHGGTVSERP